MEGLKDTYAALRTQRTIVQGYLSPTSTPDILSATVTFTQADLSNMKSRRFSVPYMRHGTSPFFASSLPIESENVVRVAPSPSGSKIAVIRGGEGKEKKGFAIDVWTEEGLMLSIPTGESHGDVSIVTFLFSVGPLNVFLLFFICRSTRMSSLGPYHGLPMRQKLFMPLKSRLNQHEPTGNQNLYLCLENQFLKYVN